MKNKKSKIESLPNEEWKIVESFGDGVFEISNLGRLKRKATSFIRTDGRMCNRPESLVKCHYRKVKGHGYGYVVMCAEGKTHTTTIHSLVAKAFIPNKENKPEVNHIDGNKENNTVSNLEWVTRAENMYHAGATGLLRPNIGEKHFASKPVVAYDFVTHAKLASFESAHIAATLLGSEKQSSHILEVCNGKREYAFGLIWKYREKETVTTKKSAD